MGHFEPLQKDISVFFCSFPVGFARKATAPEHLDFWVLSTTLEGSFFCFDRLKQQIMAQEKDLRVDFCDD